MRRAQQRDAARQQKFFFRRSIYPNDVTPHEHVYNTPVDSRNPSHAPTPVEGRSAAASPIEVHPPHGGIANGVPNGLCMTASHPLHTESADNAARYDGSSGARTPESESPSSSCRNKPASPASSSKAARDPPILCRPISVPVTRSTSIRRCRGRV